MERLEERYLLAVIPALSSLEGATKTIYLDFNGHTIRETPWNDDHGIANIVQPAFDSDGDVFTFSDAEAAQMLEIWERVSEDFIPFDVNVTTVDPGLDGILDTGGGDEEWGIRVVIGGSAFDWYVPTTGDVDAGASYRSSFGSDVDTPAVVFSADYSSNTKGIADVTSHLVGQTLGLGIDGQTRFYFDISDPDMANWDWVEVPIEFYRGHVDPGTGATTGWGPIMGTPYEQNLTQWSQGEYFNATNIEDDLTIITTQNGFDYRVDDHGSSIEDASTLGPGADPSEYFATGIIERNTDVDYFQFTVDGLGEVITLDISPFHIGPNLDILAELRDSDGNVIAVSNPVDDIYAGSQTFGASADGGWQYVSGPNAGSYTDEFLLGPGTYYLTVDGTGRDIAFIDPAAHPGPPPVTDPPTPPGPNDSAVPDLSDWGYSDYGSLGQYTIEGTRAKGLLVAVDFDVEGGASPFNWTQYSGGDVSAVLTDLISEAGLTTPYDLTISTTGTSIDSFASANPINTSELPSHALPLYDLDGYITAEDETLSFVWSDLEPWSFHQFYIFAHADVEIFNNVTVVGGNLNGTVQTLEFTQQVSADGLVVNGEPPGNGELSLLAYSILSDDNGEIAISVTNEPGFTAALAGLAIVPTRPIGPPQNGSIQGQKWDDSGVEPDNQGAGNRTKDAGEPGLPGWIIYLDENNDGELNRITVPEQAITQQAPDVPQEITDNNTVKNELQFDQAGTIVDVNITLDISHTYNGDLDAYLISPSGTRVKLFSDLGGFNDDYRNVTFDDEALTAITNDDWPFNDRTFRPEQHISATEAAQFPGLSTMLSAFDGEDALGIWTLEVVDDATDDEGTLHSWSITVTLSGSDIFLEPFTETDSDGNYSFPDLPPGLYHVREHILDEQALAGWHQSWAPPPVTVTSGASRTGIDFGNWIPTTQPGSIQGQKYNDLNGNGVKDDGEAGLPGWFIYIDSNGNGVFDETSAPVTVAATDLPKPIREDLPPTSSQLTVQGIGTILNIQVTVDITHSFMGDLDAHLTSPSGKRVELFSNVGGQFNNFQNVTFDDSAARSIDSIGIDDVPYTGTWQPEGSLSDFLGEDAAGLWTLTIQDTALADQGMLNSWSLTITTGELFAETDADGNYLLENLPAGQHIIREEQQSGWTQQTPDVTEIPGAVWDTSRWLVTIVGVDDPDDPDGPDAQRNVRNVDFGNRSSGAVGNGDYNGDGNVDAADYVFWRSRLNTVASPPASGADGDGSDMVDEGDYVVWTDNFGNSPGAAPLAVPEMESDASGLVAAPEVESGDAEFAAAPVTVEPSASETSASETTAENSSFVAHQAVVEVPSSTVPSARRDFASPGVTLQPAAGSFGATDGASLLAWFDLLGDGDAAAPADGDDADAFDGSPDWEQDEPLDSVDSVFELLGAGVA